MDRGLADWLLSVKEYSFGLFSLDSHIEGFEVVIYYFLERIRVFCEIDF